MVRFLGIKSAAIGFKRLLKQIPIFFNRGLYYNNEK